jgi:hypothetical protein
MPFARSHHRITHPKTSSPYFVPPKPISPHFVPPKPPSQVVRRLHRRQPPYATFAVRLRQHLLPNRTTPNIHNHHTPPSVSVISQIFPKLSFNFATKVVEALFGSENVLGTGRFAVIFFFFLQRLL